MKTNIILCYGTFEELNEEYRNYINWAVKESQENGAEKIIICGGHTNNKIPETSEAQSVLTYLKKTHLDTSNIELEDQSLTTPQNLKFASSKVSSEDQITIYCDLTRMAKVIWLSLHFLLRKNRQETGAILFDFSKDKKLKNFVHQNLSVKYFDFPSRDKYQSIAQSFSTLLEVEAIYDRELEDKITSQRRIDFKI